FPPGPPSQQHLQHIIHEFSMSQCPELIEEAGCAICGILYPKSVMNNLSDYESFMHLISINSIMVTRKEHCRSSDKITCILGPVLAHGCQHVCPECSVSLHKGEAPLHALANGLWLGKVPSALKNLTLAEKMLAARVCHNHCVVRVASGGMKMHANAIMFANPTHKIYHTLPPPRSEMDDVLAFIFTGPTQPTDTEFKRTPLLVSHKQVAGALEWLQLNHIDYHDIKISYDNLKGYKDNSPPVVVSYHPNHIPDPELGKSLHHNGEEDGVGSGPCPLVVHG
ncbi:hypothetical protein NEOLEDRAFT_1025751, partial [Neolentinus lepideus HHB14362 ss-1]